MGGETLCRTAPGTVMLVRVGEEGPPVGVGVVAHIPVAPVRLSHRRRRQSRYTVIEIGDVASGHVPAEITMVCPYPVIRPRRSHRYGRHFQPSGLWPNRTRPLNRVCLARGSGWNWQPWMSR